MSGFRNPEAPIDMGPLYTASVQASAAGKPLLKPGLPPLYYSDPSDQLLLEFLKAYCNQEVHDRFAAAATFLSNSNARRNMSNKTVGPLRNPATNALNPKKVQLENNQGFRAWLTVTAARIHRATPPISRPPWFNDVSVVVRSYDASTPDFWNTIGDYLAILLAKYEEDEEIRETTAAAAANTYKKQNAIVSYTDRLANGQRLYRILDNPKGRPSYFNYPTAARSTFRAKIASRKNTYGQPYTNFEAAFGPDSVPLTRAQLDAMNTEKIAALAKDISALPTMLFTDNLKARNPRLARAVTTGKNSEGKNIIPAIGGARYRKTRCKASSKSRKSRRTH